MRHIHQLLVVLLMTCAVSSAAQVAVHGKLVYTMTGPALADGVVLLEGRPEPRDVARALGSIANK